jgi:hypothetical protein
MPDDNLRNQTPVYTFQGSSPAEALLEIARIHFKEAKQLFDNANAAVAEDRQEEANLLIDLGIARRERAEEFERAARGEGGDPIVTEILDWQKEICESYVPYSSTYVPSEITSPLPVPEPPKMTLSRRLVNAVAWVGSWIA